MAAKAPAPMERRRRRGGLSRRLTPAVVLAISTLFFVCCSCLLQVRHAFPVTANQRARSLLVMKGKGGPKGGILRVCASNKFAGSNYELGKKYEAGVVLLGTEIGPLIGGACQLKDAYCRVKRGELYIYNLFIGKHKTTGKYFNHEERRPRKLLVNRAEITELKDKSEKEGCTLVPIKIYLNDRHRVKLELAVGKGKKKYDKRETIREREMKRSFGRLLKSFG